MKLNIGDNIRKYRKQQDMTQDQLAERLGVAYQTVSRWENGSSYPDIELLPAIAGVFSLTLDELVGMPDLKKEEQAEKVFDELRRECIKREYDAEHIVELIRDIRRNYIGSEHAWRPWCEGNDRAFRDARILPEVRLLAEACLEREPRNALIIQTMVSIEDEEHLPEFLQKHTTEFDCSKRKMLFSRYSSHRDCEKFEPERRYQLFNAIDKLTDTFHLIGWDDDKEKLAKANEFALSLLDLLRLDGNNTVPDMWTCDRLHLGFERSAQLSSKGESDPALAVLRANVALLEETMRISTRVVLPSCRWLEGMEWKAEEMWVQLHNDPDEALERIIFMETNENGTQCCCEVIPSILYNTLNGSDFDSLRGEAEFSELAERVKALIVIKAPETKSDQARP